MSDLKWVKDPHQCEVLPSIEINEWLTAPYILSQALKRVCNHLTLKVIGQKFSAAYQDEYQILNIENTELPLVRQILLLGDEVPFTYGRVIVPLSTHQHHFSQFESLGSNLLGETMLYRNPDVTRGAFEYGYVEPAHPLATEVYGILPLDFLRQPLWGRRSVFWIKSLPLLVTEMMLPTLPPYVKP